MITLIFFITGLLFVYLMYSWVSIIYLIPLWIILGYGVGVIFVILTLFIHLPYNKYTKVTPTP